MLDKMVFVKETYVGKVHENNIIGSIDSNIKYQVFPMSDMFVWWKGGWGNGYITITKEHPFFGKSYSDIMDENDNCFSQELTYSKYADNEENEIDHDQWVIGFDTNNCFNNLEDYPKERVIEDTVRLANEIASFLKTKNRWNSLELT